jgi:hypothetical protein
MPLRSNSNRARSPLRARGASPSGAGNSPAITSSTSPQSRPTTPAHVGTALLLLATCLRTTFDPCTAAVPRINEDGQVPPSSFPSSAGGAGSPGAEGGFIDPNIMSAYSVLQDVSASSASGSTPLPSRRSRASSRASGSIGDVGTADSNEETPESRRAYAAYGESSASYDDVFVMLGGGSEDDENIGDDDVDGRKKRRQQQLQQQKQNAKLAKTVAIEGCTTTASPLPSASLLAAVPKAERAALLASMLQFMPLDQIEALRAVSSDFDEAASRVVAKPIAGATDVVFVRWTPRVLHETPVDTSPQARRAKKLAANAAMSASTVAYNWRCLNCASLNNGNRACACCRTPTSIGACRVFLGQLRKELTAELTTAMLATLCPSACVLHVESHTNPTGARGRGCAWVYLDSVADARELIHTMHKRAFIDVDADGGEGFWYIMNSGADLDMRKAQLAAFAEERAAVTAAIVDVAAAGASSSSSGPAELPEGGQQQRSAATMPRQPVVAEAGANSLLAFAMP